MAASCWLAVSLLAVPTWPLQAVNAADALRPEAVDTGLPSTAALAELAGHCQVTASYGREAILCPFEHGLDAFADVLALAAVANEDKRFLAHPGVDTYRLPAAAWSTALGRPSGASTITQQTARILFLDPGDDTLSRKWKEVLLALRLESVWSKQQILTAYLNTVPLGRGVFGYERGARAFIGKPAADLSLADALILVAKAPAPERRDAEGRRSDADLRSWAAAAERAAARMVAEGFADGPAAASAAAEARDRILAGKVFTGDQALRADAARPFEFRRVRDLARRQAAAAGVDPQRAVRLLVNIDPVFQHHADAMARGSPRGFDTVAMFADPRGAVLAVAGPDYSGRPFNAAFDGIFSLASLGKVPVLMAAAGAPGVLGERFSTEPLAGYSPREDSRHCRGAMDLVTAAALSCNRPFVRATALLGEEVGRLSRAFGLIAPENVLLTPTGGLYGNPLLVTRMLGAVAAGGRAPSPTAFAAAIDASGRILAVAPDEAPPRLLSRQTAARVAAILQQPVSHQRGTARAAAGRHRAASVSGKTGTGLAGREAWFAGFTSDFVGVILSHASGPAGGMAGGAYPAERFGALVDAYWLPRNARAGAAPAEPRSFTRLADRLWRHRALDATRLSLMLLAAVLLLVGGETRRSRRQGGEPPPYPTLPGETMGQPGPAEAPAPQGLSTTGLPGSAPSS